jgi:hypothetical protein
MKQPALIISWVTNTNVLNLVTPDAIAPLPSHRWGEGPHVKKLNEFVIDHTRDSLLDVLNRSRVYLLRS